MKDLKLTLLIVFVIYVVFIAVVFADHRYHSVIEKTINQENNGAALAIATSQHNFDWGTHKWQGSVGMGSFDGKDAISLAAAKRFDRLLINISIGRESNKYGYGAGLNWNF